MKSGIIAGLILLLFCMGVRAAQTNYIGTAFIADPTTPANQMKVNADGSINVTGSSGSSSSAVSQSPFASNSITTANTYQQVKAAGACTSGGWLENTSGTSGSLMYVDWTTGASAGGTTKSNGAAGVGPATAANQSGGKQSIPPTANAVYVYGPAGTTFAGGC